MNREERRKAMPLCSAFIDEMRKYFGEPQYIKASENGLEIEWGTPQPETVEVIPVLTKKGKADSADNEPRTRETVRVDSVASTLSLYER